MPCARARRGRAARQRPGGVGAPPCPGPSRGRKQALGLSVPCGSALCWRCQHGIQDKAPSHGLWPSLGRSGPWRIRAEALARTGNCTSNAFAKAGQGPQSMLQGRSRCPWQDMCFVLRHTLRLQQTTSLNDHIDSRSRKTRDQGPALRRCAQPSRDRRPVRHLPAHGALDRQAECWPRRGQNPWTHWRSPMVIMRQGCSVSRISRACADP